MLLVMFSTVCYKIAVSLCFSQSLRIFSFSYFYQLFVEITCQEFVEKLKRILTIVRAGVAKIP